jgi:glycosyltransferase involved in cell wall biosynthesis
MKVSVLIPAYQAGGSIAKALDSLRSQTHLNWEVIVVEDGSHDQTQAVVESFASTSGHPVVYRNLGHNHGVGAVRNRLLALATGDVVAFLDADDWWEPVHLQFSVEQIRHGADLVVSGVQTFDLDSGVALDTYNPPASLIKDPVLTLFERSVIITSSSVVLTKALADRTGQFDTTLRIGEDRDFWLRCALDGGRFASSGAISCHYAKHVNSSMARTTVVAEHDLRFYEKYRTLADVPARLRRRQQVESLVCLGRLLRRRDPQRSASCFWRAWRYEPFNPRIPFHLVFNRWRALGAQSPA